MTETEILEAIKELTKGLPSDTIRDISIDIDDWAAEVAFRECEQNGHQVDNDMCGKPEHRFCRNCYKREAEINAKEKV